MIMPAPLVVAAGLSALGSLLGSAGTAYSNRKAFERERQHDIQMFRMQQEDRDRQNVYNAPPAQVARLLAAGINPATTFGQPSALAESSPVSASPSASMSGTNFGDVARMGIESALIPLQIEQIKAQVKNTEANTSKAESETSKTQKETDWIDRLNKAKEESINASAMLDKGRYNLLSTQKSEMLANIEKLQREADTEIERQYLLESQRLLNDASIREINSLLPLKSALMYAQTLNEKAQAGLALVNTMYQKGLIDVGYIDMLFNKVKADTFRSASEGHKAVSETRGQDAENFRNEFKNAIINGETGEGVGGFFKNLVLSAGLLVGSFIPGASNSWLD